MFAFNVLRLFIAGNRADMNEIYSRFTACLYLNLVAYAPIYADGDLGTMT